MPLKAICYYFYFIQLLNEISNIFNFFNNNKTEASGATNNTC